MYLTIKHVHMSCVALSLAGFLLRGFWMATDSPLLRARLTRVVPHMVDAVLLGSALVLASDFGSMPGWVWAKVLGLLFYIAFGMLALKPGRTKRVRLTAFAMAVAVFVWIVSVALTKVPAGFFA